MTVSVAVKAVGTVLSSLMYTNAAVQGIRYYIAITREYYWSFKAIGTIVSSIVNIITAAFKPIGTMTLLSHMYINAVVQGIRCYIIITHK